MLQGKMQTLVKVDVLDCTGYLTALNTQAGEVQQLLSAQCWA
jgi:hypothetical protein